MRFKARISNAGDCIHLYRTLVTVSWFGCRWRVGVGWSQPPWARPFARFRDCARSPSRMQRKYRGVNDDT